MFGDRSGREPLRARSPLVLRRRLGLIGALFCAGLLVVLVLSSAAPPWTYAVVAVFLVIGLADALFVHQRIARERGAP